jgi:hypothetical protein
MNWMSDAFGALLLVAGLAIGLAAKKRRFDRTNAFGMERFPTFGAKLRIRSGDYVLKGAAIASLSIGTLLLSANHIDTWGWIVMAPVCLFILYLLLGN